MLGDIGRRESPINDGERPGEFFSQDPYKESILPTP